jgi:hypothetical protein
MTIVVVVGLLTILGTLQTADGQIRKPAIQRAGRGNEVEGAIWQYTATIDKKDKKMSGKIRIDGRAIFAHTERRVLAEKENRVGDITTSTKDTMQMVFNEHPELKGRAIVEYDRKAGYWRGYFDEKGGQRWKFEMRRGDD